MLYHTCREKTHEINRCSIVSSAWSHNGQRSGWGRPLLARRSAVQHLLCATNHMKNLHLPGAQLFQILSQGPNCTAPIKNPSYADLVAIYMKVSPHPHHIECAVFPNSLHGIKSPGPLPFPSSALASLPRHWLWSRPLSVRSHASPAPRATPVAASLPQARVFLFPCTRSLPPHPPTCLFPNSLQTTGGPYTIMNLLLSAH
jgi:hypothetical protein